MKVYPIFLNRLNQKKTIIIGGNNEASRKVKDLLECDANITLISSELNNKLLQQYKKGAFHWIPRNYRKGDLKGAFLVIVASYDNKSNQEIYDEADELGLLINVMDDVPHCNFTFGSIVKRGPLTLSISTSGTAPTIAVRLRERFEKEFGVEYEKMLTFLKALRKPVRKTYPDFPERKQKWYALVDSGIVELYQKKEFDKVREKASEIMGYKVVEEAEQIMLKNKKIEV